MSMSAIRKTYGVPAKRGGRVVYTSVDGRRWPGTITGSSRKGLYVRIRVDDSKFSANYHPTENIEYLP